MLQRLTPDNWVTLGILLVSVTAAVLLIYLPQGEELEAVRHRIVSQKMVLSANTEKAAIVPRMIQQIEAIKRRHQGFERRLPKRKELGGFLREISSVLASEQLSNQLIRPRSPTREVLFHTLPINMKFRGSYLSLASMLQRIDEMERLTRVQRLSIRNDRDTENLNIEVQMNIYFNES